MTPVSSKQSRKRAYSAAHNALKEYDAARVVLGKVEAGQATGEETT